ncbi:HNH endonuclease [Mesorhizobium sp. M1060]|uniref:HNH endonuclease n=1 Tax=unclassified Mesorhizobium TaxID=325217 RepID=UPI0033386D45
MEIDGQPVIFCFAAWMSHYEGAVQSDVPVWAGKRAPGGRTRGYFLGEVYNFLPLRDKSLKYRLFGDVQARFNTKRLGGNESQAGGVTIVWCAADPRDGDRVKMVGWYRNATVHRENQEIREYLAVREEHKLSAENRYFNIICDPEDGRVLHSDIRPPLPHTPGLSALGRWHSSSKSWMGDNNSGLRTAVTRWLKTDWDAAVRRKFGASKPIKRRQVLTTIRERQGQSEFRKLLLNAYNGACAVTGCSFADLLDACHIDPVSNETSVHSAGNGIILRTDLHTLFDLGFLAIDPESRTVWISPDLTDATYLKLAGKKVRPPEIGYAAPSTIHLGHRWKTRKSTA